MQGDARVVLLHTGAMMIGENATLPDAAPECIQQHHLQVAAMDGELRMVVAGRAAERLLIDQLPEAVEEGRIFGLDRDPCEVGFEAERAKLPGRMRQEVDADADRANFRRGFENTAADFGGMQRKAERQATDAAADNQDVVHVSSPASSCGWMT